MTQGTLNSATGFGLGTAMTLGSGADLGEALKQGGQSAALGLMSGIMNGTADGIRTGIKEGIDPFTGKSWMSERAMNSTQHANAKNRNNDLDISESKMAKKTTELVMRNRYRLKEGDNTFVDKINGINKSIKAFVRNGEVISTNLYPRISNRRTDAPIIKFGNKKWK